MNTYKTKFFSVCPVNKARIEYHLTIVTGEVIGEEELLEVLGTIYAEGFHEPMADDLHKRFGGIQTLTAHHHGVEITTVRSIR